MNSTRPSGRTSFSLVVTVALIFLITAAMMPGAMGVAVAPSLGVAGNFSVLSDAAISDVPSSVITGNVGLSTAAGSFITGLTCGEVSADIYVIDATSGLACAIIDPVYVGQANSDRLAAYTNASTQPVDVTLSASSIGGMTLAPGVYFYSGVLTIPDDVTLSGGTNDVWIFQSTGLVVDTGKRVILSGGALPQNVYWANAGTTSLGSGSIFNGNILSGEATTEISLVNTAKLNGRALSKKTIALNGNTITRPDLVSAAPVVSFTNSNGTGSSPLYVSFSDFSTGTGTLSYNWSFGDGTYSIIQNPPLHTYSVVGTYPVSLTVTDGNAISSTLVNTTAVNVVTAPALTSAVTNAAGTRFILTFDKAMTNPVGKHTQFSFQNATGVKAFDAAVLNGTNIDLTTLTPVVFGDVVNFSYAPGTITSTDGGVLALFTDQPVTNNVPAAPVVPTVISASTNTAGTVINITFSKTMASPAANLGSFKYQIGGGADQAFTAIALNATTSIIDLVPTTPIAYGDVVTVNYTAGTVTASDLTVLANFASQPVTNSVPASQPTMTGVAPISGTIAGGTFVTITGTGYSGATAVTFDGVPATAFTIDSNTQINATTPAHAAGAVNVNVTTPGGLATGVGAYTYATVVPTFTGITPASGPITGSTPVSIAGTGFTGATGVTFDGIAGTALVVVNDTHITATTPAHAAGPVNVNVTTPGGTVTGTGAYTYTGAPTFTGIIPASGSTLGGTAVTITGTNFVAGGLLNVTIGGAPATSIAWVDATHLTAVTPAGTAGAQPVVITNNDGQTVTQAAAYTYVAPPTFTSIAPNFGPTLGGTAVTITGTNFVQGGSFDVIIGTTSATSIVWVSATQITAVTPPGTIGSKNVKIINNDGQTATGTNAYTYVTPPTYTSITPASGSTAGGNVVTITGTGFTGATAVAFGITPATAYTVQSATRITATVPAHAAGVVDVVITTPGGIATGTNAYTYVTPTAAVTLGTASNYAILAKTGVSTTGTTQVNGNIGVSPAAASYITGFALTPDGPPIVRSTAPNVAGFVYAADYTGGSTSTDLTTAVSNMETAYTAAMGATPFVTEIGSGNLGGMTLAPGVYKFSSGVTIPTDLTLDAQGNSGAVWIFQIDQTLDLATSRHVILSNGAQAQNVFWAVAGTTTLGANSVMSGTILDQTNIAFTTGATLNGRALAQSAVTLQSNTVTDPGVTPASAPTVTIVSPVSGSTAGINNVTITGTGFTGATTVTFGGVPVTNMTVFSATQINATTPANIAGSVDIVVNTPSGIGTGTALYTYADAPTFGGITPATGSTEGGNLVTISGTGFTGTTGVTFDGIAASAVTVISDNAITAITPAHAIGAVNVIVTTGVAPVTGTGAYTYVTTPIPTFTSITPASGPTDGGTVITITGTGFTGATSVTFDGVAAAAYTVNSATQITATTPSHIAGAVNVAVTTLGGTQTGTNAYTFVGPTPAPTAATPVPTATPYIISHPSGGDDFPGTVYSSGSGSASPSTSGQTTGGGGQLAPTVPSSVTQVYGTGLLASTPFSVDIGNWLGVAVSWTTQINDYPDAGARITTAIQPNADQQTLSAYTTALHLVGLDIGNLAYVMIIQKSGVTSSGPATVTMNVPQDWVDRNGGISAIRIVRFADDGTTEVLSTTFIGNNPITGYPTFEAQSPHGLSTFGLIAVVPYYAPAVTYESGQMAPTQQPASSSSTTTTETPAGVPMMAIGGILAALVIVGIAVMTIVRRNKDKGSD